MYLPKNAHRRTAAVIFIAPSFIGLIVFLLIPIVSSLVFSQMDYDLLAGTFDWLGLKNFTRIFTGREFPNVLLHTLTYLGLYMPLMLTAALAQGMLLNKAFKGRQVFRTIFYLPVITSWVAASVLWMWILSGKYGLLNQMLSAIGISGPAWLSSKVWAMPGIVLAAIWKDTGFYALMVLAGLKSIDTMYYEAAAIDGAGSVRRFFNITMPLLSPTLFLLVVINVIAGLQVFEPILIMTEGGPGGATTVFLERIYRYAFTQYKMGMASAYSWILFLIILVFTAVQFRLQKRWVNYDT
ncbi:MAG: sugar ABC transporter permease [Bacillota bacterium]